MFVDEIQLGFMPEKGTIDGVSILRRKQEEYYVKEKKLIMCFVDLDKAFDKEPRKVLEWALRKKEMSLYKGEKTRVRVDSELSEEFEVKVGMHQGSVLSPFLIAVVVDVVTELAREGVLSELQYADDLVLMNEIIKGLRNKFMKCRAS